VSNIGTWMQTVAVGSLLAKNTGRASDLGVLAAAAFVPTALFAPIGGVIADRVRRKPFLLATLTFDTVLACLLAVLLATGVWSPAILWVIVFAEGCSTALSLPNRQALMPELVPPDQLMSAIGLGSTAWNGGRVIGPLLAGVLIAATSTTWAVIVNALSFVVMLVATSFITIPDRRGGSTGGTVWGRMREGFSAVASVPSSRFAVLSIMAVAFAAGPFIGLIPIVAHNVFGGGPRTTSVFVTAQGLGAIAGALAVPKAVARFGRVQVIISALALLGPLLVAYGTAPSSVIATAALVPIGAMYFVLLVSAQGLLQAQTDSSMRARAMAIFSVALGVAYVVSVTANGFAADGWSLRGVHLVQGVLSVAGAALLWTRRPRGSMTAP
jgi:MFS family permease